MTIAIVADVHCGNHRRFGGAVESSLNQRALAGLATLRRAAQKAVDAKAEAFIIAGDLFDYARPEAPLIREVQRILAITHDARCRNYVLVGNHDQTSNAPGDHALAPLAPFATIVEQPAVRLYGDGTLLLVPFQPGPAKEWLPGVLRGMLGTEGGAVPAATARQGRRALVLHLGIRDDRTPPWLRDAPDAIDIAILLDLCEELSIDHVFAGNWHDRQQWSRDDGKGKVTEVFQCGALVPTGWDNPTPWDAAGLHGKYGTVVLLDGGATSFSEIAGPRFVKTDSVKEAKVATVAAKKHGHQLYVSLTAPPEELDEYASWVAGCTERGEIAGGEVIPDATMAKHEAKNAAAAAQGAETIDEALSDFVGHTNMADHVDRGRVLARCRQYLKGAR